MGMVDQVLCWSGILLSRSVFGLVGVVTSFNIAANLIITINLSKT